MLDDIIDMLGVRLGGRSWNLNRNKGDIIIRPRNEVGPTNRTSRVRSQPKVNARRVEDMTTFGDKTQCFMVLKLVQANGTFECAFTNFKALDCGIYKGGESSDDVRVEAVTGVAVTVAGGEVIIGS